jgi:glutamate--cysteine ligase
MDFFRDGKMIDDVDDCNMITESNVESYVRDVSFKISEPKLVGAEFEWLVRDTRSLHQLVSPVRTFAALEDLRIRGKLTAEPGGQLELSSVPADLETCVSDVERDLAAVTLRLGDAGLELAGLGFDPYRPPFMFLPLPRYAAMQDSFNRSNYAGRLMLCSTASVQVAIDAGQEGTAEHDFSRRWYAVNALAPVLTAIFANSPMAGCGLTGWKSTRQAVWLRIDPTRTRPPRQDLDPRQAWAQYVLDANVICIRRSAGKSWTAPAGLTFRKWIDNGLPRRPTMGDLRYHVTTLFPPVRPRGYLELRMIDAQWGGNWVVPVAVAKALFDDASAMDMALESVEPLQAEAARTGVDMRMTAAGRGLSSPLIGKAAARCFEVSMAALRRMTVPQSVTAAVESFADSYVYRGRCPADDLIESRLC